ncbi:hypothetical protein [Pseudopedobacter beijingensis]|uniref:Piwi domain-containing protein n=1 Tax=Pseudopedobacter beijingensis TaxID=1207056 RepID=A0ABW4IDR9_9SPHI
MIEPVLAYINEPFLTFGNGQQAIDPRDGLLLFGPFDHMKVRGIKNVGIIGPKELRKKMINYLNKIHSPIINSDTNIARPNFPGLETIFGISVNFENIIEVEVKKEDIENYLKYTDSHQRVHNWVNLYVNPLIKYTENEEMPADVWFVVIPEDIFRFGRPNSRIQKAEDNIDIGLKKQDRNTSQLDMFFQEEKDILREAYEFEVNFHNQLKAKILHSKIVTQIIRESKIAYEDILSPKQIEEERKFDTAKAWNISNTLYYKLGGLPWKLGEVREGVCYLGLVYKKTEADSKNKNACCAAQMFLDSGDGMVFRGNVGPWWNPKTGEFHLSKEDAYEIVSQSIEAYHSRFGNYPNEIFIHAKTFFDDTEWEGFEEAVNGKSKIIGIRIRQDNTFKLYRQGQYCVPRGTMLQYNDQRAFLWTKGFIPRFKTQIGLETPNPIDVSITRGYAEIDVVCKDILSLTKLNYNACIYGDGVPVTLKFADSIGEILTAGKEIKTGVLPFKHYI